LFKDPWPSQLVPNKSETHQHKLAKSVKQNNRPKGLESIISRLVWLEYNHRDQLFEVSRPVVKGQIGID